MCLRDAFGHHGLVEQWSLTFPTPRTPIPKDADLGASRLRNLQSRCMIKEQTQL